MAESKIHISSLKHETLVKNQVISGDSNYDGEKTLTVPSDNYNIAGYELSGGTVATLSNLYFVDKRTVAFRIRNQRSSSVIVGLELYYT